MSNNAGAEGRGGLALLTENGQVDRMIMSFLGSNKTLERQYLTGKIAVELCPQGTLAERIRAAGSGIPAFFTPTGGSESPLPTTYNTTNRPSLPDTLVQQGAIPVRFDAAGNVVEYGQPRETRIFGGKPFLMETALHGDVAILRAHKVDKAGNCVFRYTTRSFGPLMAKAARVSIVEAEEIVEVGEIDPGEVDLPGIYIDRIVPATESSRVEILKTRSVGGGEAGGGGEAQVRRDRIARRAARELKHGFYVNLGVGRFFCSVERGCVADVDLSGIPTLAPSFLPAGHQVWIQSENGILGMGDYPLPDQVDP